MGRRRAGAALYAAMARPGGRWALEAGAWLAGALASWGSGPGAWRLLLYHESMGGWGYSLLSPPLQPGLAVSPWLMLAAAGAGSSVCSLAPSTLPSGSWALVFACTLAPLSRAAMLTASPKAPQRGLPGAVLARYTERLLAEGTSFWRLSALLASSAGGRAALLAVLVEKPGRAPAPLLYAAAGRDACISTAHHGGYALLEVLEARPRRAATGAAGSGECSSSTAVQLRPTGGAAVRMEVKPLERALNG